MTDPALERFTGNTRALVAQALGAYGLDYGQMEQMAAVLAVLEGDELAPTTIRTPQEAARRHLADSLEALGVDAVRAGGDLVDLGAGAGFPGVALAVALPRVRVRLLESQRRKCDFLERLLARAGAGNASVVCARAEEWGEGRGGNDVALARALAAQPVVLEYAAPLLRLGGTLVDWRGRREPAEERQAERAGQALGMERREIRMVEPFADAKDRHLHVWLKTSETPERFPRRAGMARKRPLGG